MNTNQSQSLKQTRMEPLRNGRKVNAYGEHVPAARLVRMIPLRFRVKAEVSK